MKNDKTILVRLSNDLYSKLKSTGNANAFARIAMEEKFNRNDYKLNDFTYITRAEVIELVNKEMEARGIKHLNRVQTSRLDDL